MTAGCYTSITHTHTLVYAVAAGSPWSGQEAPMVLCTACGKASEKRFPAAAFCIVQQSLCDAVVFNLVIKLINSQVICGEVLVGTEIQEGGEVLAGMEILYPMLHCHHQNDRCIH